MQGRKGETLSRFCPKLQKTARDKERDKERDKKFAKIGGGGRIGDSVRFARPETRG